MYIVNNCYYSFTLVKYSKISAVVLIWSILASTHAYPDCQIVTKIIYIYIYNSGNIYNIIYYSSKNFMQS